MKNFALLLSLLVLFSCKKNDSESPKNSISEEFKKIETSYTEGCVKNEGPNAVAEPATRAPQSYLNTILPTSNQNFGTKTNTLKSTLDQRVGVFKNGSCGSYAELDIFMDCQDGGNSTSAGYIGSSLIDGNKNVTLKFCLVPKSLLGYVPGAPKYAVLSLDDIGYNGNLTRYFDNEDSNNTNALFLNGTKLTDNNQIHSQLGNGITLNKNFTLIFQIFNGAWGEPTISDFPDLGISYGVLGNDTQYTKGMIVTDDEYTGNANQWWYLQYNLYTYPQKIPYVSGMISAQSHSTQIFMMFVK